MPLLLSRIRPLIVLAPVMLTVLACGAGSTVAAAGTPSPVATATPAPTSTSTPAPTAVLTEVSTVKQVSDSAQGTFSASATCSAGQVMVSGGYRISGGANAHQADVLSSYPTGATTWSVSGLNASVGGALTLTAFADCLKSSEPVTATIASAGPGGGTVSAACPGGSLASGGGYQGSGHFSTFAPTGTGWAATLFGGGSTKVFAVCVAGGLHAASTPSVSAAVASGGTGTASVACPAGQLLAGGGYTVTPPAVVFTSAGDSALSHWQVQASDRSFGSASNLPVAARAVCLSV